MVNFWIFVTIRLSYKNMLNWLSTDNIYGFWFWIGPESWALRENLFLSGPKKLNFKKIFNVYLNRICKVKNLLLSYFLKDTWTSFEIYEVQILMALIFWSIFFYYWYIRCIYYSFEILFEIVFINFIESYLM